MTARSPSTPPRSPRPAGPQTGDDVVDALLRAGHRVRTAADTRLRAGGLSLSRLKALQLLVDGPLSMSQVSALLAVAPRSTTDLVDGLADGGLVERFAHPTDRRVVMLRLTEDGADRLARSRRDASEVASWATRRIPADRHEELVSLLDCIGVPDPPPD